MSRRRDDYERSRWKRFKEWVHGETDLLANGMEIQIPEELEALGSRSDRTGDAVRNEFQGDRGARSQESREARFQKGREVRSQESGAVRFLEGREARSQESREARSQESGEARFPEGREARSQESGAVRFPEGRETQVQDIGRDEAWENEDVGQHFQNMRGLRWFRRIYQVMSVILCMSIIFVLLWTIAYLPAFGNAGNPDNNEVSARYIERGLQETGAVNIVTGMILDYRAFDTFGESCVLFIASCCVLALLRIDVADRKGQLQSDTAGRKRLLRIDVADRKGQLQSDAADRKGQLRTDVAEKKGLLPNSRLISKNKKEMEKHTEPDNMGWAELARRRLEASNDRLFEPKDDLILQKCACVLVPLIFVFGIYIVLNGHLSPGGGFSGGAVLGSGLILYLNAFGFKKTEEFFTEKVYRRLTLSALTFYCVAKSYSFFTGANHLESGIPLGTPGAILSSGLILPLNICVGLVVACTMYAFYALFRKGGM